MTLLTSKFKLVKLFFKIFRYSFLESFFFNNKGRSKFKLCVSTKGIQECTVQLVVTRNQILLSELLNKHKHSCLNVSGWLLFASSCLYTLKCNHKSLILLMMQSAWPKLKHKTFHFNWLILRLYKICLKFFICLF